MSSPTQSNSAQQEVLSAMEEWRQATVDKDTEALDKLLHEDLTYSHSNCRNESKRDVLEGIGSGKSSTIGVDLGDLDVRVYGDTAIVKGDADFHNTGGSVPLNVLYVWVKDSGNWRMVARQATRRP